MSGTVILTESPASFKPLSEPKRIKSFEKFHPISSGSLIGRTLDNRYRIEEKLADGGIGVVYLSTDIKENKQVALKVCHKEGDPSPLNPNTIYREAMELKKIKHKNIVDVLDAGIFDEKAYVVMEYMRGEELDRYLKNKGRLEWLVAKRLTLQLCDGLEALHTAGIVHADMKPKNIFIAQDGTIKILDFEISRFIFLQHEDEEQKLTGVLAGTPTYMSPEQSWGKQDYDHRSDLYSLGIIMYKMLCGVPPFIADDEFSLLLMHREAFPSPPMYRKPEANIPKAVNDVIMKALEKEPEKRFQSAAEMKQAIEQA